MRSLLLWLGGHDPKVLAGFDRAATASIAALGGTVLLAAGVTGASWGLAAYSFAGSHAGAGAAAFGAAVGVALILGVDRVAIGLMDIRRLKMAPSALFFSVRLVLAMLVGSQTTHLVAPYLMRAELASHALHMRERADDERVRMLNGRFNLDQLRDEVSGSTAEVASARSARDVVPPAIVRQIEAGRACWRQYRAGYAKLAARMSESAARQQRAAQAARCRSQTQVAQHELELYRRSAQHSLATAERRHQSATNALGAAKAEIATRLADAYAIERSGTTEQSSAVLADLIATNQMARLKWWGFYALALLLELLPLITKLLVGQSAPGARLAAEHHVAVSESNRRIADQEASNRSAELERVAKGKVDVISGRQRIARARFNARIEKVRRRSQFTVAQERIRADLEREQRLRQFMDAGMEGALSSTGAQQQVQRLFLSKIEAFIPVEVAKHMMAEFEAQAFNLEAWKQRFPDFAEMMSEVWLATIEEVIQILQRLQPNGKWAGMAKVA